MWSTNGEYKASWRELQKFRDLTRVLSAVDAGTPREEIARPFSVSMPTIERSIKRRREAGDVEPRAIPGRHPRKGAMLKEWLPEHLQANDDLTLEELREGFEEEVSTSTIGRAIAACQMATQKKQGPRRGASPHPTSSKQS